MCVSQLGRRMTSQRIRISQSVGPTCGIAAPHRIAHAALKAKRLTSSRATTQTRGCGTGAAAVSACVCRNEVPEHIHIAPMVAASALPAAAQFHSAVFSLFSLLCCRWKRNTRSRRRNYSVLRLVVYQHNIESGRSDDASSVHV